MKLIKQNILSLSIVLGLSGCAQQSLQALKSVPTPPASPMYATVDAHFCTTPPVAAKTKIKYLFIIDKSGSNQNGTVDPLNPNDVSGTDPSGSRRYAPLLQFIRNLKVDPNMPTYLATIDFNSGVWDPTNFYSFTLWDPSLSSSQQFLNGLINDWIGVGTASSPSPWDNGYTDYERALQQARTYILNDASAESVNAVPGQPLVQSTYEIIFVSDGIPNILQNNALVTEAFDPSISGDIQTIMALKDDPIFGSYIGQITLNTAYYFQNQQLPAAEALLKQMANVSGGMYLQFGLGQNILYQAFVPSVHNLKNSLADVFIENENLVWWDDGSLMVDSDGDGLPDAIELKNGSNPFIKDSDGNGVSDFVEYRMKGYPCADANCNAAKRDTYSICDGLPSTIDSNSFKTFADTDRDGLNDCEEFVLKSISNNFDSNGDFIPDFLEFKNGLSFIAGALGGVSSVLGDGVSSYSKIKLGLPTSVSPIIKNYLTRVSNLMPEDPLDGQDCYHMTVNNVAVGSYHDTIKMYFIQNTTVVNSNSTLSIAEKPLSGTTLQVNFNRGDFK